MGGVGGGASACDWEYARGSKRKRPSDTSESERFNIFDASEISGCKAAEGLHQERACAEQNRICYTEISARTAHLAKLRISIVQYLNTAPLCRRFMHGPLPRN